MLTILMNNWMKEVMVRRVQGNRDLHFIWYRKGSSILEIGAHGAIGATI